MLTTLLPAAADAAVPTTGQLFWSEFLGTAVLLLLGGGVVATNLLPKSKGKGGGWLVINWDGASRSSPASTSRSAPAVT